jgi:hypothetical protein
MLGDWGLGIGDWAQSPIPNFSNKIESCFSFMLILKIMQIILFLNNLIYFNNSNMSKGLSERLLSMKVIIYQNSLCKKM